MVIYNLHLVLLQNERQKTLPRRIDQRELGKLIIQMAEQNKEKERCSGSYRQAVGFLVIKIGTYEILFFLNLYSISHNSKVLSENKKRIPEINGVTRRLVTN